MEKARDDIVKALEIVNYLAVKYQNRDADEACLLLASALKELENG